MNFFWIRLVPLSLTSTLLVSCGISCGTYHMVGFSCIVYLSPPACHFLSFFIPSDIEILPFRPHLSWVSLFPCFQELVSMILRTSLYHILRFSLSVKFVSWEENSKLLNCPCLLLCSSLLDQAPSQSSLSHLLPRLLLVRINRTCRLFGA